MVLVFEGMFMLTKSGLDLGNVVFGVDLHLALQGVPFFQKQKMSIQQLESFEFKNVS